MVYIAYQLLLVLVPFFINMIRLCVYDVVMEDLKWSQMDKSGYVWEAEHSSYEFFPHGVLEINFSRVLSQRQRSSAVP